MHPPSNVQHSPPDVQFVCSDSLGSLSSLVPVEIFRSNQGKEVVFTLINSLWPDSINRDCCFRLIGASMLPKYVITKKCLYNFDPLKPHSYIVKQGLQEHTLFFLFLFSKAVLTSTHNPCFWAEICKKFLSENFQCLDVKFSIYLNKRVFVMFTCHNSFYLHYSW